MFKGKLKKGQELIIETEIFGKIIKQEVKVFNIISNNTAMLDNGKTIKFTG